MSKSVKKRLEKMLNKDAPYICIGHVYGFVLTVYGEPTGAVCKACCKTKLWPEHNAPFPYTMDMKWNDFDIYNSFEEIKINKLKKRIEILEEKFNNLTGGK